MLSIWVGQTGLAQPTSNTTSESPPSAIAPANLSPGAADVLKLTRAKVGEDIIVAYIQSTDRRYNLRAEEIVHLQQQGVSSPILVAMLNETPAATEPAPAIPENSSAAGTEAAPSLSTEGVLETPSTSTVYVIPASTTYYAFDGSWPYWYDPWPYAYRYYYYPSYWYSSWCYPYYWYPFFSLGVYWGACGYYHGHQHGGDCHYGHHSSFAYRHPRWNGQPSTAGRPGPGREGAIVGRPNRPDGYGGKTTTALNQRPVTPVTRAGGSALNQRPSSFGQTTTGNRLTTRATAPVTGPASISRGTATSGNRLTATRPAGASALGANRSVTRAPGSVAPQARPITRSVTPMAPRVQSGPTIQRPLTLRPGNGPIGGASPISRSPTVGAWNRAPSQSFTRSPGSFAPASRSAGIGSAPSFRSGGMPSGMGRPGVSSSFGGMRSTPAFRGGGGFSGASAPRMSSGGGYRGGGGPAVGGGGFRGGHR